MKKDTISRRWSAPRRDLRHADRLDHEAGALFRDIVTGTQDFLSQVVGLSPSWVSRQVRGARGGVQARLHQLLVQLVRGARSQPEKIRAGMPLAGGFTVLVGEMADFRGVELRRFCLAASVAETRDQASEDVAQMAVVQLLERLQDHPSPAEAAGALELLRDYKRHAVRELASQLTLLAGTRALEERLEEVARGVH